jgi:pimeloyl-ACP methyl ester carboxylesterase
VEDGRWRANLAGYNSLSLTLGILLGYIFYHQLWIIKLIWRDLRYPVSNFKNRIESGSLLDERQETEHFVCEHVIKDGIERVIYRPVNRRQSTPILMQHGMWHGAWCWQPWQELFAEWGWESHAYSLPGHGRSAMQRPIERCTLHYYLGFLKEEVQRLDSKPVFFGHSMGVALGQWWLKHARDDFPAMVWVAGWDAHSVILNMVYRFLLHDPLLLPMVLLKWNAAPIIRSPRLAADILLSPTCLINPDAFHSRLSPESILPIYQHSKLFWKPPEKVTTPILWIAAKQDFTISTKNARKSAGVFGADYCEVEGGHDLFYEPNWRETAEKIQFWLEEKLN